MSGNGVDTSRSENEAEKANGELNTSSRADDAHSDSTSGIAGGGDTEVEEDNIAPRSRLVGRRARPDNGHGKSLGGR